LLHAITIKYNPFVIPEKNNAYCVWVANEAIPHMLIKRSTRKEDTGSKQKQKQAQTGIADSGGKEPFQTRTFAMV
jgi:hypothetical protein